ncbi:hypothetical protein H257_05639 [Aphanomyces astaci]|uniref:Uncharacterized protein n=1 Tax=Aphanomyces astaci TaxID=112090 RepID=W4GS38_APHAT|nr:hypothetical protein H257_05639 [Aphanomyces astaci]ETV82136.1 hypothetical protein H257_05639 [Aphanomyces astaci]|eukprot:XP_009828873.1 hypothetical protein H257_05639 [Aphanomyces astaci]
MSSEWPRTTKTSGNCRRLRCKGCVGLHALIIDLTSIVGTVTEHFIDEIGALAATHMAKHEGTPLTSDILKSLVHASKSQTFDPVRHVLDTLTIPPHREKPVKKRVKASSPRRAKKVVKRTTEPKKAASVVQPAPSVDLIEEDDDYDASD